MDYEKGAPRNLVQFSEYNDLAFTDTGVKIDDQAPPNKHVIWSSEKIEKKIADLLGHNGAITKHDHKAHLNATSSVQGHNGTVAPHHMHLLEHGSLGYYENGYKRYIRPGRFHRPRILKPSWWLSFIIPSRKHYCEKCCNYNEHKWATVWNDDPIYDYAKCNRCSSSPNRLQVQPPRV